MAISVERFSIISAILARLANVDDVLILISRPYTPSLVSIEVDDETDRVAEAVSSAGLSKQEFQEGTDSVASALSVAIEERSPVVLARQDSNRSSNEQPSEDERREAEEKLQIVNKEFDVDALRARAWVKKGSKHDIILERSWEVTRKEADSDRECPVGSESAPIGVLRFSSGSLESPLALLSGDGTNHLVAVVDRVDIRSLIRSLERLDVAMAEAFSKSSNPDV